VAGPARPGVRCQTDLEVRYQADPGVRCQADPGVRRQAVGRHRWVGWRREVGWRQAVGRRREAAIDPRPESDPSRMSRSRSARGTMAARGPGTTRAVDLGPRQRSDRQGELPIFDDTRPGPRECGLRQSGIPRGYATKSARYLADSAVWLGPGVGGEDGGPASPSILAPGDISECCARDRTDQGSSGC
jgi:hypothetical protein